MSGGALAEQRAWQTGANIKTQINESLLTAFLIAGIFLFSVSAFRILLLPSIQPAPAVVLYSGTVASSLMALLCGAVLRFRSQLGDLRCWQITISLYLAASLYLVVDGRLLSHSLIMATITASAIFIHWGWRIAAGYLVGFIVLLITLQAPELDLSSRLAPTLVLLVASGFVCSLLVKNAYNRIQTHVTTTQQSIKRTRGLLVARDNALNAMTQTLRHEVNQLNQLFASGGNTPTSGSLSVQAAAESIASSYLFARDQLGAGLDSSKSTVNTCDIPLLLESVITGVRLEFPNSPTALVEDSRKLPTSLYEVDSLRLRWCLKHACTWMMAQPLLPEAIELVVRPSNQNRGAISDDGDVELIIVAVTIKGGPNCLVDLLEQWHAQDSKQNTFPHNKLEAGSEQATLLRTKSDLSLAKMRRCFNELWQHVEYEVIPPQVEHVHGGEITLYLVLPIRHAKI